MAVRIDSKTARARLKARREPYWHKVRKGGYVGYRRTQDGGTWIARWRTETGQKYEALGDLPSVPEDEQFDRAKDLAEQWFKSLGHGAKSDYTVLHAIDDYVKHLRVHNTEATAKDTEQRLYKHAKDPLGTIRLTKLTTAKLVEWRDSMVRVSDDPDDVRRSKDTANRVLSMLKASLNLAYHKDIIGTDRAWKRVKAFEGVGEARKVFLTDKQITRLLEHSSGGLHAMVKSLLLTGMRPGIEPAHLLVEQFNAKDGTLDIRQSKTGPRVVYLSDEAVEHFKALAKDKHPKAYLHTKDDGEPWGKSHQQRPMKAAIKAAKLPKDANMYSLRHTHISAALLAGVNAQVVAENTGTSVRMIEKHYGKFLRTDRRAMFNQVRLGT